MRAITLNTLLKIKYVSLGSTSLYFQPSDNTHIISGLIIPIKDITVKISLKSINYLQPP